ncbi:hypothetical protein HU200_020255 [Digitaria exilis]|uniref:Uncharacterized protein n=1 Tax=Digitaria exilis TaxID=1010633 RepID=A0A835KH17_9POAL|nr:hypothetical protein HU200_020255 [Digitaria exilis]
MVLLGNMPRYDDRYGNTRLYVGRLSSRTRSRDLEYLFSKYGSKNSLDEFSDPHDADDAQYNLDGREVDGSRIIVEFAKGVPRGSGGSREYMGRGPPPGTGRCFNCGIDGHWARDCKAGDWKNKCYRCGERGHIERNCQNSPRNLRCLLITFLFLYLILHRSRSISGSPRGGRRDHDERRSRSLSYSRSPRRSASPSAKEKERSPTPNGSRSPRSPSPRDQLSPLPKDNGERNGSEGGDSPVRREDSRSRSCSPSDGYRSPAANGRSPSPRDDRSPSPKGNAGDDDGRGSPRGSRSP